jgi:predicted DNA-binding transcriptional regulator YafY
MKIKNNPPSFSSDELGAIYKLFNKFREENQETEGEYYDDYYDSYEEVITPRIIKSVLSKITNLLPNEQKEEIDKDFLRKKYHTFNNYVDENVYSTIERAFSQLKTIEITYFNMESAEFSKRKIDVYYKSRKYTIGYCHLRKEIRKFRTSRIASVKLTKENYKIPKDFDKNNY